MEGDTLGFFPSSLRRISIHTLRMEGDLAAASALARQQRISIHTLRMEGDWHLLGLVLKESKFQSTPSAWRVTPEGGSSFLSWMGFQSTPSAWRVTYARFSSLGW